MRPLLQHRYGFMWGPFDVTRIASHTKGDRTVHIVGISTDHHKVEVSASKTGRSVRVWIDGKEVKA